MPSKERRERRKGTPSGFEDVLPREQLHFNEVIKKLTTIVESYAFTPLDTPTIEWMDTLAGKVDSGSKLIYQTLNGFEFPEDPAELQAKLDKGLRFDLTVGLARCYGDNAHKLPRPFKRWQSGKVFRGERAQTGKGRYREFFQFDADTIGVKGDMAGAETAAMLVDAMRALNLPAVVKINNRRLLDGLVDVGNIADPNTAKAVFEAIDNFDKIGKDAVIKEILKLTNPEFAQLANDYLSVQGDDLAKLEQLETLLAASFTAQQGLKNLNAMITILRAGDYEGEIAISPEIVRGLSYYTDEVFETFVKGYEKYGSVASGGRYDHLIRDLGGPDEPAVGASFGVSRILDVLNAQGDWDNDSQTPAKVMFANFEPALEPLYLKLATELRQNDIPTLIYADNKKLAAQLKFAGDSGIPYAVLIGSIEQKKDVAKIRNLETRQDEEVATELLAITIARLLAT